ncbi:unnamed protein product [Urochloa humidicola]
MDMFGAPATNPGFAAAAFSFGGRGIPPRRGSGGVEELDLDLHLGLPYGAVGEADLAGGRRGAAPSRPASAARAAAMASRTGWGGDPAGTAARPYRTRPANAAPPAAGRPPVGGRGGVPPRRGSGVVEELDLDLHLGLPYGERLSSTSAGAVGEAAFAGGRRGAAPSRAAGAAMATRTGWRRAPAGTAARPSRAPRPANAAPVGGRGVIGGGAGVAAGRQYADDGALGQESQDSNECDDGGDESEDWGEESDDDGDSDGSSSRDTADSSSSDGEIEKMLLNRRKSNRQFLTVAVGMGGISYRWVTYSSAMKKPPVDWQ